MMTRMLPVLLRIGPFTVYSYGAMMAVGFLVAGYLIGRELDRKGLPGEVSSTLVFWAAIGGLLGSRVWALAEDWRVFLAHPLAMIFSGSGFVWYGGLLGGIAGVFWCVRRRRLPWLEVTDAVAPALALGHGIGRIGCQLAGDGDWGKVSDLPWAMAYPNAIVGWHYAAGVRVHPTPIYELLAYVIVFCILWSIRKRPASPGTLFWWYLVLAPGARFLIEFLRINPPALWGLSQAQLFSLVLVGIGTLQLCGLGRARVAHGP